MGVGRSAVSDRGYNPRLCLRFDRDFRFHGVGDEALLVCGMIHLLEFFRCWLLVAGEFRLLVENDARDRQSAFGIFLHMTDRFINIFVNGEDIRFKDGPKTKVQDGAEVSIIPAIAGGAH